MIPGRTDYVVKKFQRSSADHALQIPHLLRTPEALLRTIGMIESQTIIATMLYSIKTYM